MLGLAFALFGVGMTIVTGDPVWDGIGTVAIGVLLGIIAIVLMVEMKSLLIGEGATATQEQAILDALAGTDDVERVSIAVPSIWVRKSCWSRPRSPSRPPPNCRGLPPRSMPPNGGCARPCR